MRKIDHKKIGKAFREFGQSNTGKDMAKWILTDPELCEAQVTSVNLVYQDGVTFKLDCTETKAYLALQKRIGKRRRK